MPKLEPERHTMKGWGMKFADWNEPRTLEEAQATAQLATTDRMLECMTHLEDIMLRLARLERFLHDYVPGYKEANQPPGQQQDVPAIRAIAGVYRP